MPCFGAMLEGSHCGMALSPVLSLMMLQHWKISQETAKLVLQMGSSHVWQSCAGPQWEVLMWMSRAKKAVPQPLLAFQGFAGQTAPFSAVASDTSGSNKTRMSPLCKVSVEMYQS